MKQILKQGRKRMSPKAVVRPVAAILVKANPEAARRVRVKAPHLIVQKAVATPQQVRTLVTSHQKIVSKSSPYSYQAYLLGFHCYACSYISKNQAASKRYARRYLTDINTI
jgi:hypothetical protein